MYYHTLRFWPKSGDNRSMYVRHRRPPDPGLPIVVDRRRRNRGFRTVFDPCDLSPTDVPLCMYVFWVSVIKILTSADLCSFNAQNRRQKSWLVWQTIAYGIACNWTIRPEGLGAFPRKNVLHVHSNKTFVIKSVCMLSWQTLTIYYYKTGLICLNYILEMPSTLSVKFIRRVY